MRTNIIKQIFFCCIAVGLLTSCTSITKLFPKQPRPFQSKKFNSEQWKSGDYQIRGEMAENLRELVTDYKEPWKNSVDEVRQILGEPDVITQADCCYVGRASSPSKVEMWLYYVEIEEDYLNLRKEDKSKNKIIPQAFKVYFPKNNDNNLQTVIGDRNGDHSVLMPVVGYLNRKGGKND